MKKDNNNSELNEQPTVSLASRLVENSNIEWIVKNGRKVLLIILAVILTLILFYRMSSSTIARTEQDFNKAEKDYVAFKGNNDLAKRGQSLQNLKALLREYPELQTKYDGMIAQTLLDRGDITEAKPFAERGFARLKKNQLLNYLDFSKTTILISDSLYADALKKAKELKVVMAANANESSSENVLFAYNLLRIAMLERLVGTPAEELAAWQTFKDYTGLGGAESESKAAKEVIAAFTEGKITLVSYIEMREAELKKL